MWRSAPKCSGGGRRLAAAGAKRTPEAVYNLKEKQHIRNLTVQVPKLCLRPDEIVATRLQNLLLSLQQTCTAHCAPRTAHSTRRTLSLLFICILLWPALTSYCQPVPRIPVDFFDPGYTEGDSNYEALTAASDGMIYFSINSHMPNQSTRLYRFNPADESIEFLGDINEVLGEDPQKVVPQGKIHVPLFEHDGYLYFATHLSYYKRGLPHVRDPQGRAPYPGGHFMRYHLATKTFEDLAHLDLPNEGIITMEIDRERETLYGLTWPTGLLISYNLNEKLLHNWGAVQGRGEWGQLPDEWDQICRVLGLDANGYLYGSTNKGQVWRFDASEPRPVEYLSSISLSDVVPAAALDKKVADNQPVWGGWVPIVWNPGTKSFWGLHGESSELFEFEPQEETLRAVTRMGLVGSGDGNDRPFRAGLGFKLGPDNTLYYLASGPSVQIEGRTDVDYSLHLMTYDINKDVLVDHGVLVGPNDRRIFRTQNLEIAPDGSLYTAAWVEVIDPDRIDRLMASRGNYATIGRNKTVFEVQLMRFRIND